jgi:hypothetical protein
MVGIGFVAWKRTRDFDDYILGGRSLGGYVTALSAGASDSPFIQVVNIWIAHTLQTAPSIRFEARPIRLRTSESDKRGAK